MTGNLSNLKRQAILDYEKATEIFYKVHFLVTLYMFIFMLLILLMVLRQLAIILSDGGLVQDWTGGDSDSNLGLMSNFDRRLKCPS